ncbi:IclR family transcriptional regulator [Alkalilacustris brevis]|uniref:IclR family transcriptional regulator n=1 Tax=Alkalilacustris brevis TaxID=2026338 RepID=UPI001EE41650|nr:IclR family transcriptional regulator [Alkalilacustris brevis]
MSDEKGVAAVDRALTIMATFDNVTEPLSLSEIARRAGLHKSTTLRLIGSLKTFGYIVQFEDGRYHLGPTLLRLGTVYQRANRMEERIIPVLEEMVRKGSESPSFYIRHGRDHRLCIFRVDSNHSTLDRVHSGLLLPLDSGAAGHVFRAFETAGQPPDERLRAIREQGYAVSHGETDPDCAALAAPVFNHGGDIAGVLSISGPRARFDDEIIARQLEFLRPAAERLSRTFGGRYDFPAKAAAAVATAS